MADEQKMNWPRAQAAPSAERTMKLYTVVHVSTAPHPLFTDSCIPISIGARVLSTGTLC